MGMKGRVELYKIGDVLLWNWFFHCCHCCVGSVCLVFVLCLLD